MDLPFKFCKIGLKNTLFIFGRKNGRLLFVVCCCCCLLQLCPILAYFFLKPFLKGKILRSSERGVNWSQKYFIYFWQKKWSFVVVCCCLLFVATLSNFGLLFF